MELTPAIALRQLSARAQEKVALLMEKHEINGRNLVHLGKVFSALKVDSFVLQTQYVNLRIILQQRPQPRPPRKGLLSPKS